MTYEETKRWLSRAYKIDKLINSDRRKIKELEELALSIPAINAGEKVQSSRSVEASYVNKIININERKKELEDRILKREYIKIEIDNAINLLEDNELKLVLTHRYIHFDTFQTISDMIYSSIGKCSYLHDRAIVELSTKI